MKLGIMQPYFFPYIGYFQLLAYVDKFVIHDDVQYIKGGWINRNRILINGQAKFITLSIRNDSSSLNINQRYFVEDIDRFKQKLLRQIEAAYARAPFFAQVRPLIEKCFSYHETNVSAFIINSLLEICRYLEITTPLILSSELEKRNQLKGQDRVVEINQVLGAQHYINPIGGVDLYDKDEFLKQGITLSFIKSREIHYQQFGNNFIPYLSILDVMMFNHPDQIHLFLAEFDLI